MIVIISDLHLTDGTTGETIHTGAFRLFRERLSDMAYDASWRSANNKAGRLYRPIEVIDLIILGDFLDVIRSTLWTQEKENEPGYTRPWDDPTSDAFINKVDQITDATLDNNRHSLAILRAFSTLNENLDDNKNRITIPPATEIGEVNRLVAHDQDDPARQPVPVRIHYVVGNHDWFFHLPGERFDRIRQKIIDQVGLVNPPTPFPHTLTDSETLLNLSREHHLFWRHGDMFDPFNYDPNEGRNAASLGDALVVELFNRFPEAVENQLGDLLPEKVIAGLKEVGNVYPELVSPIWINGLLKRHHVQANRVDQIKAIWNDLVREWLRNPFVKSADTNHPGQLIDATQFVLRLSTWTSFELASKIVAFVYKWKTREKTYREHALGDAALYPWAKYIVYGHTHTPEMVPLDFVDAGNEPHEQLYFNCGTWHVWHKLAIRKLMDAEFTTFKNFTYIGVFKDDERLGRGYETWTGNLDA
ncbi:MAG: hypothetical protein AAF629_31965 [Chloroflexota bacterium]